MKLIKFIWLILLVVSCSQLSFSQQDTVMNEDQAWANNLLDKSELIVVVTIASTDYRQTAADGPMFATATVLKCIKGNLQPDTIMAFQETAWWMPSYKSGETRILFLKKYGP